MQAIVLAAGRSVFCLERGPREGQTLVALHNLTPETQTVSLPGLSGRLDAITARSFPGERPLRLGPYEVLWLST